MDVRYCRLFQLIITATHTINNTFQLWFGNGVIDCPAIALTGQQPLGFHQAQMSAGGRLGKLTQGRDFIDCKLALEQNFYDAETVWVGGAFQTLGSLFQVIERHQFSGKGVLFFRGRIHNLVMGAGSPAGARYIKSL